MLARPAIRSIPVVVIVSPLSVVGVAIEQVVECVPLRSIGVTLLRHYYEDIRLPIDCRGNSYIGARDEAATRKLWDLCLRSTANARAAYEAVLPSKRHRASQKTNTVKQQPIIGQRPM